jgi:murein DD-endopeptidase MepM/ murein hydrolase activator NlpD|tara:strand:+ start:263 stop:1063 length:801 start_codon:yes stop_codon:yes gene_type:complete
MTKTCGDAYCWAIGLVMLSVSALVAASDYQQGELVIGEVAPGTEVWLDDVKLQVSDTGLYVFGLGRNAAPEVTLVKRLDDAHSQTPLQVDQRQYLEQKINGLPSKKVTPKTQSTQRIGADNQKIGKVRQSRSSEHWLNYQWIWPVAGRISGEFGSQRILNGVAKNPHNGVDIAVAQGTNIVAPLTGEVALVHERMFYTGKTIMLDHGLGVTSVYAHMQHIEVSLGQVVKQGQVLGQVGQTGRATGPHLHWGVTWRNTHVDPLLLLN